MVKKNPITKIVKVIYFDEGTATDQIYINEGGEVDRKSESIARKEGSLSAEAEAKAEGRLGLFFAKAAFGGGGGIEGGYAKEVITNKAILNTILTDYLSIVEKDNFTKVFDGYQVKAYKDSISFYKTITPFAEMMDGKVPAGEGFLIDVTKMDLALENAKGYYELIASKGSEEAVLRFNIKAFRNNYCLSDLLKMDLVYYAIQVGSVDPERLTMANEFTPGQSELTAYKARELSEQELKPLYDVVLAGVKK